MKKNKLNALFCILFSLIFLNCGARKVKKTQTEEIKKTEILDKSESLAIEEKEVKEEVNIKKNTSILVDNKDSSTNL